MSPFKILISGAGQLGSRYLQGLASCRYPLSIIVQDNSQDALDKARQRWSEVINQELTYNISFQLSLNSIPESIDIAIVATNADVRLSVVREILNHSTVRYWVLEKVLCQSEEGLDQILEQVSTSSGAWVNTSRRVMPWHKKIKSQIGLKKPMNFTVQGGDWGLACNAVHFLDLFAWWTEESLVGIDTNRLIQHWFESKRKGFMDISGTLDAIYSNGSTLQLTAKREKELSPIILELTDGRLSWVINETDGSAIRSDGINIIGSIAKQSQLTGPLVESILKTGSCGLPDLEDSIALHKVFLASMLSHYRHSGNPAATVLPIT